MKDLKFQQNRTLSRLEAADQLTEIAAALSLAFILGGLGVL